MDTTNDILLFDLHCDTIFRCNKSGLSLDDSKLQLEITHIPDGLRLCQCMAVFIPDDLRGKEAQDFFLSVKKTFDTQMNIHSESIAVTRDPREISALLAQKQAVCMLTVEGGAVLGGDLGWLEVLADAGVRMMTLTWNGANEICGGAQSDEGFTPFGREVVARMRELRMAVDVSHLNDKSFWELCELTDIPFAASHSNARAVCKHRRNLTDDMFRELTRRGGVAGLNYCVTFIAEFGKTESFDDLLRHLHHFLELGGEDSLALGSDFDGADMPHYLPGSNALPELIRAMERSGIPDAVIRKILFENALRFFEKISLPEVSRR